MPSFVMADELIGEHQTGHQTSLFQPEDGCKRSREEDTLDGGKGHQALGERRLPTLRLTQGIVSTASRRYYSR
jgi:hypothetical protein